MRSLLFPVEVVVGTGNVGLAPKLLEVFRAPRTRVVELGCVRSQSVNDDLKYNAP